jgi:hypothetical protein
MVLSHFEIEMVEDRCSRTTAERMFFENRIEKWIDIKEN